MVKNTHSNTKFPANKLQIIGACITAFGCGSFVIIDGYVDLCRFPRFLWFFGVTVFGAVLVLLGYRQKRKHGDAYV